MKNKIFKIINSNYFLWIIIFSTILFLHHFFNFSNDDVTYFGNILNDYELINYLIFRYNNWTSRVLIESLLVFVSKNIYLWRILNSLVICLLIYSINYLFGNKSNKKYIIFVGVLFLLYPFYQMSEAGFAATTLNYLWVLSFLLFSFIPLKNVLESKKINKILLPLNLLSFVYACNQEQGVCIGFVVALVTLIYCYKKNINKNYSLTLLIISIISLVFILTCPGNSVRVIQETATFYPDYVNANFLDKLFLGIVSTCSILFSNFLIIWLFSFVILCVTLVKPLNNYVKIISLLLFLIVTGISFYRVYVVFISNSILEAYTYGIFGYTTTIGDVFSFKPMPIFIISTCFLTAFLLLYLVYQLFKEESFVPIMLLLIGCSTRIIMGFSPTIFASGTRTMIFLYFSILIIIFLLWKKYKHLFSKIQLNLFYLLIIIFAVVNYILTFLSFPLLINK